MRCGAGGVEHWPALSRWQSPEYLLGVAGQRTVPVEVGSHYLEEGWGQQLMPLADFLDRHVFLRPDAPGCPAADGTSELVSMMHTARVKTCVACPLYGFATDRDYAMPGWLWLCTCG